MFAVPLYAFTWSTVDYDEVKESVSDSGNLENKNLKKWSFNT